MTCVAVVYGCTRTICDDSKKYFVLSFYYNRYQSTLLKLNHACINISAQRSFEVKNCEETLDNTRVRR